MMIVFIQHYIVRYMILHVYELIKWYINGPVQERRNSITNALKLHLFCTYISIWMYVPLVKIYTQYTENFDLGMYK